MRWLAWVACVVCCDALAGPGDVHPAACEPLGSSVRQERLSQLLRELAGVRRLRVENRLSDDPVIRHAGGSDVELMTALSSQVNLAVRYAAARECPGKWRVVAIWVLPGEPGSAPTKVPAAAPPPLPSASDRAAMEIYMQGHGG